MSADALPAGLLDYFAIRADERAAEVDAVLARLTARERALIREIAVMANVRGMQRSRIGDQRPPADSAVLADVISACIAMPDLYPTLARITRRARRELKP